MKRVLALVLTILLLACIVPSSLGEAGEDASDVQPVQTDCTLTVSPSSTKKKTKKTEETETAEDAQVGDEGVDSEASEGTDTDASAEAADYPEDDPAFRLADGNVMTRVRFSLKQTLTVDFSSGTEGVYVAFYDAPTAVRLSWMDASGAVLSQDTPQSGLLNQYFAVPEGATSLVMDADDDFALSDVMTFDSSSAPTYLPLSNPLPGQCDLMVIAAQTTDESNDFAGLLPYYMASGYSCVQAFVSAKNRQAEDDAILSLRTSGLGAQPLFGGYKYRNYYEPAEKMVRTLWKEKELKKTIKEWIETCRPQVIVTHEDGGEGGEALRGLTTKIVLQVVEELKDTVSVAKVYTHATDGNGGAQLDLTSPLANLNGKSPEEIANLSYNQYTCTQIFNQTVTAQPSYKLSYTTVGEDGEGTSLFENVPTEALSNGGLAPEPAVVTPEPQPEVTVAPATPEPTQAPAPVVKEITTKDVVAAMTADKIALAVRLLPIVLGIVLLAIMLVLKKPVPGIVLLVIGLLASGALLGLYAKSTKGVLQEEAIAAATTPVPTATPEPTPEPEPQVEEAEEPETIQTETAEEVPSTQLENAHPEWDEYFRSADDPQEVVVFDYDNGKYEYRTDNLSILIDRKLTELPLTYYVAHIRMRNVDAFRPGFGTDAETGSTKSTAWEMARRYKAVLLITGDDMTHMEADLKGIILRNGTYYSDDDNEATMAMTPGMSMRIFHQGTTTVEDLKDLGIENTFAFGPILMENGEVYKQAYKHRVRADNPRVGVGMVEPGHFVVIVVDGRLKGVSLGMPIMEFAELFKEEGCKEAFNMDGGASAAMVFMGEFINMRNTEHVRTMPDGLMWGYSLQVPDETDPLVYSGEQEN